MCGRAAKQATRSIAPRALAPSRAGDRTAGAAAAQLWDHEPVPDPKPQEDERAHDVLAAEAFAVPVRDPTLAPARDVLAAEEFAVPAPDPSLRHWPVVLPEDPSGITEPHDVLAAEEFAMPAGRPSYGAVALARRHSTSLWRVVFGLGAGVLLFRRLGRGRPG